MTDGHPSLVAGKQITKGVSLVKPLTTGGMGAVWLADHHGLKTQVVVKFMLGGLDKSDSARTRFSREAAAAAQVKSPHVVQMLDHGVSDDGIPFIVMEHLAGHDLGDELEQGGPLDPVKAVAVITQVAKALSKVHAAGFLHRDIKPDNIFLVDGEEEVFVKLLDFGIAKSSIADQGDGSLDGETKTGQIVGTPFYMSPEQVTAQKKLDHRSDLWSLGVVAYEALTGKRPYDGPSFGALAVKIATGSPPRPTHERATLPATLDAWFAKACARDVEERFASAKEMSDAFRAAFDGVVSIPSSSFATGDSGQRSAPSGSVAADGSGERRAPTPNVGTPSVIGLAATALDGSDAKALARSEAGVSEDVLPSPRSSTLVYVGGAIALSVVVAFVLLTTVATEKNGATGSSSSASAGAKPERSVATMPKHVVSVVPSVQPPPTAPEATTTPEVDAAAPPPAPTRPAPATLRPAPHSHVGATKATSESSVKAPPTAKPADSTPDLF